MNNVRPPSPDELVLMLAEAEERLAELRTAAYDSAEARQRLEKLEQEDTLRSAHEQVRAAGVDPGAAATGEERVRDLQAGLDEIEEAAKLPSLIDDLQNALADCAEEVGESGLPADRRELTDIQNRAKKAIADRDATTIAALQERATDLYFDVRRRSPTWDAEIFQALRRMRDQMQPTSTADTLLWEGEQAIASGSYGQLPGVNQRLRRLLPADAPVSAEGGLKQRGDR
jgi:molecular chaperone DnaK